MVKSAGDETAREGAYAFKGVDKRGGSGYPDNQQKCFRLIGPLGMDVKGEKE